ncbi:hypothetical protein STENM223S_00140 [Streptomyces tendae]
MSKIHSCWVPLGSRSALIEGIAKYRTETSIETSRSGSIRTASAVHSRRPARGGFGVMAVTVRTSYTHV